MEEELDGLGRTKIDASTLKTLSFQRPDYETLIDTTLRQLRSADDYRSTDASSSMMDSALRAINNKMRESDEVYLALKTSLSVKTDKIGDYVRQSESAESVIKRLLCDEVIDAAMVERLITTIDGNVRDLFAQQKLILKQHKMFGTKMNTRILAKLGIPIALLNARIAHKTEQFDDSLAGRLHTADVLMSRKMSKLDEKMKVKKGSTVLGVGIASTVVSILTSIFIKGAKS